MQGYIISLLMLFFSNCSYSQCVDLRPLFEKYGIPVYDQGKRGICSVFALAGVVEFEFANSGNKDAAKLSVEFLNWASNQVSGEAVDRTFFTDAIDGIKKMVFAKTAFSPMILKIILIK